MRARYPSSRRARRIAIVTAGLLVLGFVAWIDAALIEADVLYTPSPADQALGPDAAYDARIVSTPWHRAMMAVRTVLWLPFGGLADAAGALGPDGWLWPVGVSWYALLCFLNAVLWAWLGVAGWERALPLARQGALKNQGTADGPGVPAE